MGNGMGHVPSNGFNRWMYPEVTPGPYEKPTFDSNLGFESGRQERVMLATKEEMVSAKLPLKDRDYCAHLLLEYRGCRRANWPWAYKCGHEKHSYLNCQHDDFVLRMKEYERERRLRVRAEKTRHLQEIEAAA